MHLDNTVIIKRREVEKEEEENFENEIEFFLVQLYEINYDNKALPCKINSFKRMKLTRESKTKKVNLERTRRLVTHLCNHGQYQFLYDTFKKNYFEIWTNNMQAIQQHEFLSAIQRRLGKIHSNFELSEFINNHISEWTQNEILNDYLTIFTRFWCHHQRSTQIICNVYLSFDFMYKRYISSVNTSNHHNEYLGFIQNANSFLKSIMLCMNPVANQFCNIGSVPISIIGVLLSVFTSLNEIRDISYESHLSAIKTFKEAVQGQFEKTFFMIRKIFEMFIGLEIINQDLKNLYLEILRRYYLKAFERKKSLGFKDYVKFVCEALEFEKSLLVTPNNKDLINKSIGVSDLKLNTSLLSFIRQDQKITFNIYEDCSSLNTSHFGQISQDESNWDLFFHIVELDILNTLVSDDIIHHYSNINQGQSCLTRLVVYEEFEILELLFNIFKRKSKEQTFRKELERSIIEQGIDLVKQLTRYRLLNSVEIKDYRKTNSSFEAYMEKLKSLLELYLKVERIWRKSFQEDEKIRNLCINEAWIQILNSNDTLAKEIMRGFSMLIHCILMRSYYFHNEEDTGSKSICTRKRLTRANLDIISWNVNTSCSGNSIEENSTNNNNIDNKTIEYFESIIYLFKCSNFKDYFQKYYHQLLSQRLVYYYTNNRIGFGGNQEEIIEYYYNWSKSTDLKNNIEMLMNKVDIYEIYLLKLLYNECGYTFINKSNFIIKDWFASQSIFKFYLLESIGRRMAPKIENMKESNNGFVSLEKDDSILTFDFGNFSQRKKRITKSLNSSICEEIHSWLKSEDLKARYESSSLDNVGLVEDDEVSNFVISNCVPSEIQKSQENEEIEKERILRNIQYDVPFSLIVLSCTNWPLENYSHAGCGAKGENSIKEDGGNQSINFVECELFLENKENSDILNIYNEMQLYQQFYTKIYSRTLTWSYFLGTCIMDYCMHANGRQHLKMILTLQQGILLLCFNNKSSVYLNREEYLVLRDNIGRLFDSSRILKINDKNLREIELPPVLKLHDINKDEGYIEIEYNMGFEMAIRAQIESGEMDQLSNYLLNFASGLNSMDFCSDFNLDYIYKEKDFLEENIIKSEKGMNKEEEVYNFEYDSLKGNSYISLFKNNKYRIEAIIMKFLKHKQKSPLLNIIQIVMNELSLNKDGNIQDNKMINGEILKILNSLIQRDLIEIDSENEQFYNYIP